VALFARTDGVEGAGDDVATSTPAPRAFVPSPQQAAFLDDLVGTESHLLLEARAGTGKSTTCRQGAWALARKGRTSTYACFNSHIAREFQTDLPSACKAATLHSIGLGMVKGAFGSNVQIDADKLDRIADRYFPGKVARPVRRATIQLANLARDLLLDLNSDIETRNALHQTALRFDVDVPLADREEVYAVVPVVLGQAAEETAVVDFGDMVWFPIVHNLTPSRQPDALFIDEAQDLNPIQHAMLDRICPDGRHVVIGDRYQSIYAWRGADSDSIPNLAAKLAAEDRGLGTLPLTVTRRCPALHVELARRIVPDIEPMPGSPDGLVEEVPPGSEVGWVEPGDMVLCRTNAPLVGLCYRLIRQNVKAIVRGRDIGKGLVSLVLRLRARDVKDLLGRLSEYRLKETDKLVELRNPEPAIAALTDKCDTLAALCDGASTVAEVIARAETLFADTDENGAVLLSSVHRAKGLERDRVLILRPELLPGPWAKSPEDIRQELNVTYVAATRSKRVLAFAGDIPPALLD
jgi:DNA helicase II / ATP-dependent DNA helicase PcrA